MNVVIGISACVSAFATVVIAVYAYKSHQMTEAINAKGDEDREKFNNLLKAIATSTLLSANRQPGTAEFDTRLKLFNKWNEDSLYLKDINE